METDASINAAATRGTQMGNVRQERQDEERLGACYNVGACILSSSCALSLKLSHVHARLFYSCVACSWACWLLHAMVASAPGRPPHNHDPRARGHRLYHELASLLLAADLRVTVVCAALARTKFSRRCAHSQYEVDGSLYTRQFSHI